MREVSPKTPLILSRPEGRLQHELKNELYEILEFQSSAAPKDGCNAT